MPAMAFGPTSCPSGLVLKSELLHSPEAQSGFVPKHSRHGGKNIVLRAEKPILRKAAIEREESGACSDFPEREQARPKVNLFFSGAQRNGVFASDDVLRCEAMCGDVVAGAGACSLAQAMTAAQRLEELRHQQRGF